MGLVLRSLSLAFGFSVMNMVFVIGHILGYHLSPDVSIGLWANGRSQPSQLLLYILAQVLGGILASGNLCLIASGAAGFEVSKVLATNAVGFPLTLIHLIIIPETYTSVNPALNTGMALFRAEWAIAKLWLFCLPKIEGGWYRCHND